MTSTSTCSAPSCSAERSKRAFALFGVAGGTSRLILSAGPAAGREETGAEGATAGSDAGPGCSATEHHRSPVDEERLPGALLPGRATDRQSEDQPAPVHQLSVPHPPEVTGKHQGERPKKLSSLVTLKISRARWTKFCISSCPPAAITRRCRPATLPRPVL